MSADNINVTNVIANTTGQKNLKFLKVPSSLDEILIFLGGYIQHSLMRGLLSQAF